MRKFKVGDYIIHLNYPTAYTKRIVTEVKYDPFHIEYNCYKGNELVDKVRSTIFEFFELDNKSININKVNEYLGVK